MYKFLFIWQKSYVGAERNSSRPVCWLFQDKKHPTANARESQNKALPASLKLEPLETGFPDTNDCLDYFNPAVIYLHIEIWLIIFC